jgi:hypothetical protein
MTPADLKTRFKEYGPQDKATVQSELELVEALIDEVYVQLEADPHFRAWMRALDSAEAIASEKASVRQIARCLNAPLEKSDLVIQWLRQLDRLEWRRRDCLLMLKDLV